MGRIGEIVVKEIREALPATIFFFVLFHLIGLTKAVALADFSFTALRSAGALMGALIVAKAILLVEALPMARLSSGSRMFQIFWKTLLYALVVLLFRFVEELIPFVSKHGGLGSGTRALMGEISWPLFSVLAVWIFGALFLYCLASELMQAIGPDKVKQALFGARTEGSGS